MCSSDLGIAARMREQPLLPPDPRDATRSWTDVDSGVCLPHLHCAFRGSGWTRDYADDRDASESVLLHHHVFPEHLRDFGVASNEAMAYYCAAIRVREDERMPCVGVSVDRRTFASLMRGFADGKVESLVFLVCAQVKVCAWWNEAQRNSDIVFDDASVLARMHRKNPKVFDLNLGLKTFLEQYAEGRARNEGPFAAAPEFEEDCWEWRRWFRFSAQNTPDMLLLCCPEDVVHCGGSHPDEAICERCRVAICAECRGHMTRQEAIPMRSATITCGGTRRASSRGTRCARSRWRQCSRAGPQ